MSYTTRDECHVSIRFDSIRWCVCVSDIRYIMTYIVAQHTHAWDVFHSRSPRPTVESRSVVRGRASGLGFRALPDPCAPRTTAATSHRSTRRWRRESSREIARDAAPRRRVDARRRATARRPPATRARAKKTWAEERRDDDDATRDDDGGDARRVDARIDGAEPQTFAYEPRSKSKRRRGKTTRRATVEVDSPAVDALLGKREKTLGQETEEAYVTFLFAYVCVIFVLGVVLGVSAFGKMPEAVDGFVSERLYPFFTPFVGGFLAFSSAYGVIKTRDDPNGG